MQVPVTVGWLFALWTCATAAADVENMLVDDACATDDSECGVSLRQLRGELRLAEADVHREEELPALKEGDQESEIQDVEGKELAGASEEDLDLLALADTDGDGEVQHAEALQFVESLGKHSHDDSLALFQTQDADSSKGLNGNEFAEALEAWGGGCATHHVASYCSGGRRTCCAHRTWGWSSVSCSGHHYSACGGYGGGGIYHGGGYPGGGYHSGGGYHYHTPYGGGGSYHYHAR